MTSNDLTGQRFGRLTVIKYLHERKYPNGHGTHSLYLCKCDCGNEKIVTETNLESNSVKSCGCYRREFQVPDFIGKKFGMLKVIDRVYKNEKPVWMCECDCGNICYRSTVSLKSSGFHSCGCYQKTRIGDLKRKHGMTGTRVFSIYCNIKRRCYNPNDREYIYYGGKGIALCDEWLNDFSAFYEWAKHNGYNDSLTIDRIDNSKGYSPENCRWATRKEQNNNTTRCRFFEYNGETLNIAQICEKYNINRGTLDKRLKMGWSISESIEKPVDKRFSRTRVKNGKVKN